jgi:ABC-2 type transport system permease protein
MNVPNTPNFPIPAHSVRSLFALFSPSRLRVYAAVWRTSLANAMEYRVNFLTTSAVGLVVAVLVNVYLWQAVYESASSHDFAPGAYSASEMMTYIVLTTICFNITRPSRFERAASEEIRTGELSKYLLKPISHIGFVLAASCSERFVSVQMLVLLGVLVGVPLALYANVTLSWAGCLWALPVLLCGMGLQMLLSLALSYLAFWLDETWTFHVIKDISFVFLSGALLPMTTLSPAFEQVAGWLPFQYLAYVPAALMMGKIGTWEALLLLCKAGVWVCVTFALTLMLWKRGIKRFGAFGG